MARGENKNAMEARSERDWPGVHDWLLEAPLTTEGALRIWAHVRQQAEADAVSPRGCSWGERASLIESANDYLDMIAQFERGRPTRRRPAPLDPSLWETF